MPETSSLDHRAGKEHNVSDMKTITVNAAAPGETCAFHGAHCAPHPEGVACPGCGEPAVVAIVASDGETSLRMPICRAHQPPANGLFAVQN